MDAANTRALALLGNYLNERADFITPGEVAALTALGLTCAQAVAQLVAAACGLDTRRAADKALFETYFAPCFTELSPQVYTQDSYYTRLQLPPKTEGNFSFSRRTYAAYECFVYNDLRPGPRGEALAQIGFFTEPFSYPAVLENGRIWMTVTPNEIETMRAPLARACGRVLTYGLGLGYFAFHASQKAEVSGVTVVEKSPQALALFQHHLLPQFPRADKIHLVRADAFEFAAQTDLAAQFDYVFADIWRDVSDGLSCYTRLKALERPGPVFDYWIEPTLRFYR